MDADILHGSALVWDNHGCLPMEMAANLQWLPKIKKYRNAGCSVASLNIGYGEMALGEHLDLAKQMRGWIEARPDDFIMIEKAADIETAQSTNRLGLTFDIEGAGIISDLEYVREFYELGVRWMALAYNSNNQSAGGCHDDDPGLSGFGRELIAEMQRVGMVVCCSHVGYKTAADVLKFAQNPVIFSHSNPLGLCDHPRNIPDELIIECARTGGVVGVNGLTLFLGHNASAARVSDHIEYLFDLVGADHVGLGLDYCFDLDAINAEKLAMADTFPPGLGYEAPVECFEIDEIPKISAELLARGRTPSEIKAMLGQNWLRIAKRCWA